MGNVIQTGGWKSQTFQIRLIYLSYEVCISLILCIYACSLDVQLQYRLNQRTEVPCTKNRLSSKSLQISSPISLVHHNFFYFVWILVLSVGENLSRVKRTNNKVLVCNTREYHLSVLQVEQGLHEKPFPLTHATTRPYSIPVHLRLKIRISPRHYFVQTQFIPKLGPFCHSVSKQVMAGKLAI